MVNNCVGVRIGWIDWAKSLCMFLVILGHCHVDDSGSFVVQYIYSFHMMFFFFLSGILCKRNLCLVSLKKDIRYIILPYYVYGLILIIFNILRSRHFDLSYAYSQLKLLLMGDDVSIGPIWFLPALFICKQLFLLIKMTKKYKWLYIFLIVLSLIPVYFISEYKLNFPFFADSALCGLPFFIAGSESAVVMNQIKQMKNSTFLFVVSFLIGVSVLLCNYNGTVILAGCSYGQSVCAYYINSFSAIIYISIICIMLEKIHLPFITITSYGTIVSLGLHGIPLTVFNYYVPLLLGLKPSSYPIIIAIVYSLITYFLLYLFIIYVDKRCPVLFGLKGLLYKKSVISS